MRSSFKSQGLPRELAVKFPFYTEGTVNGTTTAQTRLVILGNSLDPKPQALQGAIATPPSSAQITSGDFLVPGHEEYTAFYGTSLVTGSSWTLQFTNQDIDSATRIFVLVCPYQVGRIGSSGVGTLPARIAELDSLSDVDLAAQPYAKVYNLNQVSSGHETRTFQVYRRTASMIGIKDLKDRITIAAEDLPLTPGDELPAEGWFIYARAAGGAESVPLNYTVRGMVYSHLTNRSPLGMPTAITPPIE